jgi:hypothetical protein
MGCHHSPVTSDKGQKKPRRQSSAKIPFLAKNPVKYYFAELLEIIDLATGY